MKKTKTEKILEQQRELKKLNRLKKRLEETCSRNESAIEELTRERDFVNDALKRTRAQVEDLVKENEPLQAKVDSLTSLLDETFKVLGSMTVGTARHCQFQIFARKKDNGNV